MLHGAHWHGQKSNYSGYWIQPTGLIAQIGLQVLSILAND